MEVSCKIFVLTWLWYEAELGFGTVQLSFDRDYRLG